MEFRHNDRWQASFKVEKLGRYQYTVRGWLDPFLGWQRDLEKRRNAGQDLAVELLIGADLARPEDAAVLADASLAQEARFERAMAAKSPPPENRVAYDRVLEVVVEPARARFSAWYEMFPRSARGDGRHGTFLDVVKLLPEVQAMGFDVLYLPPVHPIGVTARKGKNNAIEAAPGDVGSPWAIGAKEGGHKALHPQLGSFKDFAFLVDESKKRGIEVALDIAFQCSPDHPYVAEHPEWFRWRPDGTVQYAENPPKKYQDIFPFAFENRNQELFDELKSVFEFWIGHGVKIFRVDNPHTKPFALWEFILAEIKKAHPEVIFLAEAFTRPRVMHRLAKIGFSQSYTYYTWRNTKQELISYFEELTQADSREYFRPNLWPNTPDILHETLAHGGRPAFIVRAVLAATLGANWGIYGPAYELMERAPREAGSEEYLDSEKYEIKRWERGRADSLKELISRLNEIRRENRALQSDWSLRFHRCDNDQVVVYSKASGDDVVLVAANLSPHHRHSAWIDVAIEHLGIGAGESYEMHDLIGGGRYTWTGRRNFVQLDPHTLPAHVFRVVRR
jgi:starch synthase (maltosyl-transferring)